MLAELAASQTNRDPERERERETDTEKLETHLRLTFLLNSSFEILILLSLYLELCSFSIKGVKVYLCAKTAHPTPSLLQTLFFSIKLLVTILL